MDRLINRYGDGKSVLRNEDLVDSGENLLNRNPERF